MVGFLKVKGEQGEVLILPPGLADKEMVRFNNSTRQLEGTGDINTDEEVNFYPKTAVLGTGSLKLGMEAIKISASGENMTVTNIVDNDQFNPCWIKQFVNLAEARFTDSFLEFTQESSKADILTNPSWTSDPLVDWRVTQLTFEASTTITNAIFLVKKDNKDFYRAKLGTLTADVEKTVNLATDTDNTPVDAFTGVGYVVSVTSEDGDVLLKGSTANAIPYFKVGYYPFTDYKIFTSYDSNEFTDAYKTKLDGLAEGRYLGVFADLTALQTAYPTGVIGDHATVTDPTNNIWYWNGSVWADSGTGSEGDMLKAVYDPSNKSVSAFLMSSMDETENAKILTNTERAAIVANTAKVSNATHTGEVTGSTDLTVNPIAISNKTLVTAASGMEVLVNDSGILKKVDATDLITADSDRFRFPVTFVKNANLAAGIYMVIGEITTNDNTGWILPQDVTLETVTISRTDTDDADLEVLCNGTVKTTVNTTSLNTIDESISVSCTKGDVLSIRNKSTSPTMNNVLCVLWFEGII